jgi:tRNA threonylcarbamoyladenosine biosynthesis protein TsaB
MRVLAFDCSGASCAAAVLVDDRVAAQRFVAMERGQAEALLPMIDAVLREAGVTVSALDLLAVTTGPGSFTGLRIGLAAARGLVLASGVASIGITSFDAIPISESAAPTVIALDSKREELFLHRRDRDDPRLPALVAPADWASTVPPGPCRLAGDGAARLAAALDRCDIAVVPGSGRPDPVALARLGTARWLAGDRTGLAPFYLRPPDTTTPRAAASPATVP